VLDAANQERNLEVKLAALSYRGYWTSGGRPSQPGIEQDAQAFVEWAAETFPSHELVLWGQSIGAGIAANAIAAQSTKYSGRATPIRPAALILETPFVSIRRMLAALYPEKWVPYKYLWPFLRNWWDTEEALRDIAKVKDTVPHTILLLSAKQDEVVPAEEVDYLEILCKRLDLRYQRQDVAGALHNDASSKNAGRKAIADFMKSIETDSF